VQGSKTLTDVKETFFNGDPEYFKSQLRGLIDQFGITSEDTKNISLAALLVKMMGAARDSAVQQKLTGLIGAAGRFGLSEQNVDELLTGSKK
jgi:flotillin